MAKDRQETKLKNKKKLQSDRDQSTHYPGATRVEKENERTNNI